MESALGTLLLVGIPIYFFVAWWRHFLTLRRAVLLIALEVCLVSTFIPGKTEEWIGTVTGVVPLLLYIEAVFTDWKRKKTPQAA